MNDELAQLQARVEEEGWSEGLAYRYARASCLLYGSAEEFLVCVLCGWAWISVSNRCVNPDCRGFCTWGAKKGAEPTSWIKEEKGWRPRMPGEPK